MVDSGARKPCEGDTATTRSRFLLRGATMERFGLPLSEAVLVAKSSVLLPLAFEFHFWVVLKRVVTGSTYVDASQWNSAYHSCPPRAHFALRARLLANYYQFSRATSRATALLATMDSLPLSRADSLPLAARADSLPLAALLGAVDVVSPRRAAQAAALAAASPPSPSAAHAAAGVEMLSQICEFQTGLSGCCLRPTRRDVPKSAICVVVSPAGAGKPSFPK